MPNTIDASLFGQMLVSGSALLLKNRELVDSLNVFPVPDGDTGTNMSQTITSAVKDLKEKNFFTVSEVMENVSRGALRGARGNSGVILSQVLRGVARALEGQEELTSELLIKAMRSGADTAYKAVMKPKEGTILTVQRVIAEDLEKNCTADMEPVEVFEQLVKSANAILKKTTEMLPALKQAGVVDSGGKGLTVIYTGMYECLSGKPVQDDEEPAPAAAVTPADFTDDHEDSKFGYCTEFIVSHPVPEMRDTDVVRLRKRLERIGDCVLVISDMSVVKVHVHTNDPGKALQMALELGELDSIKIDNMMEEKRERLAKKAEEQKKTRKKYGMVAVALGSGFADIFRELQVDVIVDGGQTMNPSIDDLSKAIESINAENVFVLPNNTNIILAAQQAADLTETNVIVLPTKSVPMGIAAAIGFMPDAEPEENEQAMREAAENVHTASVTYAVRDTNFDGREIHTGDIMGLVDNKIDRLGSDAGDVAREVVSGMVTEDTALVTVYYGQDIAEEEAAKLCASLEEACPGCEVEMHSGGQPLYYYFISVE